MTLQSVNHTMKSLCLVPCSKEAAFIANSIKISSCFFFFASASPLTRTNMTDTEMAEDTAIK